VALYGRPVRPTLVNLEQVDIVEKMLAGQGEREMLKNSVEQLVDDQSGEAVSVEYSWDPAYLPEAVVTVIDAFLLSEHVQLVCPIRDGAAIIPPYSTLVPAATEFLGAVIHDPEKDSGALELGLLEWIDDGRNDSSTMFARAYNGQYGDVALRLGPSDFRRLQQQVNSFNAYSGDEERFDDSGVLSSSLIFRAYDRLAEEYQVRVGELFKNRADLVLPPLASTLFGRLPEQRGPEAFLERLLEMRDELAPVRRRFAEFQEIDDDPGQSIADAEKVMRAIEADAGHFARKWERNLTDNAVVQFCIDNLSFLVKLILKRGDVEAGEVAEKVAAVSPALERRLRSSAPTILSKQALDTRRMTDITRLFETKFGLRFSPR
jgi:hypothetical protein